MAIASVGTLGTGFGSGAGATVIITTTAALEAGNEGLLVVVSDNASADEGNTDHHRQVSDSALNLWSKLYEFTNANGAAGSGVTTSVWRCRPSSTLASGGTITITLATTALDRTASAWEFTSGAPLRLAAAAVANGIDAANGFGSVSISGLASKQRLYFRGLGKEANSTTALTPSTSFTVITPQRSRNNAAAVLVRGEFRINASTGETSNPTLAVTGDTAGVFVALEEAYTASAAKTVGAATAAGTATRTVPTYTASAAVSAGPATASGSATYATPTFTATAVVMTAPASASGSATFSLGTRTGTGSATAGAATASGAATSADPVYAGAGAVVAGPATAAGSAAFTAPVYVAVGSAVTAPTSASGAGTFAPLVPRTVGVLTQARAGLAGRRYLDFSGKTQTPPYAEGAAAVTTGAATASAFGIASGPHPVVKITQARAGLAGRRYGSFAGRGSGVTGVGAATVGATVASGSATSADPIYAGTAAVSAGATTAAGTGTTSDPVYTGTAAVTAPPATASGTATRTAPAYTATAAVTVAPTSASGSALSASAVYIGAGVAVVGGATASGSGTFAAPAITLRVGAYLWSREPGRFLVAPEPGRFLWSREPGRFLTMPASAAPYDCIGTFYLEANTAEGSVRRLGVKFANREEIIAGDTLSGTPTAVLDGTPPAPTISNVVNSGTNLLFTVTVGAAPPGRYVVRFKQETAGGAKWRPWAYLVLEDSRPV